METPLDVDARVQQYWKSMVEDMTASASDYADDGWRTVELHPGAVTVIDDTGDAIDNGLSVLLPDDEYETLTRFDSDAFDSYDIYMNDEDDLVLLLVALKDESDRTVVLCPLYYQIPEAREMLSTARSRGELSLSFYTLRMDHFVVDCESPANFFP